MEIDSTGWGAILGLALSIATTAVGYGAMRQRTQQNSSDVDDFRKEFYDTTNENRRSLEVMRTQHTDYQLKVADVYVRKDDLRDTENRLKNQMNDLRMDLSGKMDEIKETLTKKGISEVIRNAIAAAMAPNMMINKKDFDE